MLVPADRLLALLPQRPIAENIAAPRYNTPRRWGPINMRDERRRVRSAIDALQIDTRAQRQVRRLSGGNQQKVTIARWLASGFDALLCFDPTRGIDVGTKRQVYGLLRRLAEDGAAVLFFTWELAEFPLVCDRVVTLFAGDSRPSSPARRPTRRRFCTRCTVSPSTRPSRERDRAAPRAAPPSTGAAPRAATRWTVGVFVLLRCSSSTGGRMPAPWATFDVQSLAIDALPLAFVAMAQAIVVISGGIDLSVGSMMSLVNVLSAKYMHEHATTLADRRSSARDRRLAAPDRLRHLRGRVHRAADHRDEGADIVVTLAMLFVGPASRSRSSRCPAAASRSSSTTSASATVVSSGSRPAS